MTAPGEEDRGSKTDTQVILLFCVLFVLIIAFIFLYKKLNRVSDGQYTVRRMVYDEGGLRDRVTHAVAVLQYWFSVRFGPQGDGEEEEENRLEMFARGEGGDVERGSQGGGSEAGEEDHHEEDSSDDYSSLDGCDLRELAKRRGQQEEEMGRAEGGSVDEKGEEEEEEENKEGAGTALLIDLKQFSGNAIWSEEKTTDNIVLDSDRTAL